MTFAILAWDEPTGMLGATVGSGSDLASACGLLGMPGVGLVAILGALDSNLAGEGLALLRRGLAPEAAVPQLLAAGKGRQRRQILLVDGQGRTAAFSGGRCAPAFGHMRGTDHVAGGDFLPSSGVVGAMSLSFERSRGDPLWERLLLALQSGEHAGGDRRGSRSARLLIYHGAPEPILDLRVEDHSQPVDELRRLLRAHPVSRG